jgi:hypothetical protein
MHDDSSSLKPAGTPGACPGIGCGQSPPSAIECDLEPLSVEWLEQVIDSLLIEGADGVLIMSGHEDDFHRTAISDPAPDLKTIELGRWGRSRRIASSASVPSAHSVTEATSATSVR